MPSPKRPNYQGGSVRRVNLETGEITVLYNEFKGKRLLAPDDIVFDKSGGFWFPETGIQDEYTLQMGALYYGTIEGDPLVQVGPMPGMPGRVVQTLPGYQWLDSLKVEADGRICVGAIFNGGITVFSPDGSTDHVPVPDLFTTNLCFGGADMQDLWITASSTGKIYKTRWPQPGLKLAFSA